MKSFSDWKKQQINEFVGPRGQVDPMGNAALPMPAANNGQLAPAVPMQLPPGLQRFLSMLENKPIQYIVNLRKAFDDSVQGILTNKSGSAGRRGAFAAYQDARMTRQNFGQQ